MSAVTFQRPDDIPINIYVISIQGWIIVKSWINTTSLTPAPTIATRLATCLFSPDCDVAAAILDSVENADTKSARLDKSNAAEIIVAGRLANNMMIALNQLDQREPTYKTISYAARRDGFEHLMMANNVISRQNLIVAYVGIRMFHP